MALFERCEILDSDDFPEQCVENHFLLLLMFSVVVIARYSQ